MNASDVINAVGNSPGYITVLTGALPLSYTYTATNQTVEIQINGACISTSLQINGQSVAIPLTSGAPSAFDVRVPVAKGQSITISIPNSSGASGGFAVWARSLR